MSDKKLVVITGASSGIGEECAKVFSARGHPLLLLARRVERMEALKLPKTMCKKVNVTDRDALVAAVKEAEAAYGPTDLLINNAGLMQLDAFNSQKPTEWDNMVDVNIKGVNNGCHAVLQGMLDRECGTIINISSVAGRKLFHNHAVYCGTKFAVHAFSEGLREECAPKNVRVCVIAPGAVETELLSHTTNEAVKGGYEEWKQGMGGVLKSSDVADAAVYMYSAPQNVHIREVVLTATKQGPCGNLMAKHHVCEKETQRPHPLRAGCWRDAGLSVSWSSLHLSVTSVSASNAKDPKRKPGAIHSD
uniref:Oxidoreductase n=1 Tax=Chromera velia CCMP2878 TaxID=1169474 RepID=A0A0G4GTT7_9ALVE|eukprot:Cvel_23314.t1-p1 / transcript=Cvel_23314.t1 / gene=Cvel_23314 / organism=Chromera_velia_CCMP2878 / gene_product=Uncharacterized oxidoreductase SSP1627, putative / transcript_product=Uncharacterized oxidoreductase SSP1627, putative / location=Cvel_scaffold2388:929-1840(-) / protein_length=304 / sequence_SO=supercontig / SO=protein_coding / is_pseudo=false